MYAVCQQMCLCVGVCACTGGLVSSTAHSAIFPSPVSLAAFQLSAFLAEFALMRLLLSFSDGLLLRRASFSCVLLLIRSPRTLRCTLRVALCFVARSAGVCGAKALHTCPIRVTHVDQCASVQKLRAIGGQSPWQPVGRWAEYGLQESSWPFLTPPLHPPPLPCRAFESRLQTWPPDRPERGLCRLVRLSTTFDECRCLFPCCDVMLLSIEVPRLSRLGADLKTGLLL